MYNRLPDECDEYCKSQLQNVENRQVENVGIYGKKYCHNSPTIYEDALKTSVMRAIKGASANIFELKDNLKEHIKTGLEDAERSKKIKTLQDKLDSITHHFDLKLNSISVDTSFDEEGFANLSGRNMSWKKS